MRKLSLMIEMIVMRYREIIKFKYGYLLLWMYIVNGCKCMISMVIFWCFMVVIFVIKFDFFIEVFMFG